MTKRTPRRSTWQAVLLAGILLACDILLILADLLRHRGLLHDPRFAVTMERGFGEWFQYAKSAAIVVFLLRAARTTPGALAWGGLFAYLLVDDAFAVHENVGGILAPTLGLPAFHSLRPEQVGELLVFGIVGVAFVVGLAIALARNMGAWRLSVALAPAFAALVFFGAFVDVVHSFLRSSSYRYVAGVVEDGGEMLAMSALVAVAYWATRAGISDEHP